MSSNYTGNPSSTQAPAAAPDPDNFPIAVLPADGDPDNAASVAQAYKVLADYIAWLKLPFSKGSAWLQYLRRYRNALGHTREALDHHGLPGGRLSRVHELWLDQGLTLRNTTSSSAWGANWFATLEGAGSNSIQVRNDAQVNSQAVRLTAAASGGTNDARIAMGRAPVHIGQGVLSLVTTIQWEQFLGYSGSWAGLSYEVGGGLVDISGGSSVSGSAGLLTSFGLTGALIVARVGATNYELYTKTASGSPVFTNTGFAINTAGVRRFKIDIIGSGEADGTGTALILAYVDDNLVGPVTADLAGTFGLPVFQSTNTGAGGGAATADVGVVDVNATRWQGDIYR